jgi:hypothetical protein
MSDVRSNNPLVGIGFAFEERKQAHGQPTSTAAIWHLPVGGLAVYDGAGGEITRAAHDSGQLSLVLSGTLTVTIEEGWWLCTTCPRHLGAAEDRSRITLWRIVISSQSEILFSVRRMPDRQLRIDSGFRPVT